MNVYFFDYEVFKYDWVFVAKSLESGEYTVIHNDPDLIKVFMAVNEPVLGGFNNKHYDQYIHKAILLGATPEAVKEVNDFIILEGRNGWEHNLFTDDKITFPQFDLMDDMQKGLSLKAIEAHLGMDIRESTVDFNVDHSLSKEDLDEVIFYCKHDVDATEELFKLRRDYLNTKVYLGRSKGMKDEDALYLTNAKLTAEFLGAVATPHDDERDYVYPDNLLRQYIPEEVFAFFDRLHNEKYTDDEIFHGEKLELSIGDCECKIGWGGIHGAIPVYREKATETRMIRNLDVASYYPHLMTVDGYISRNIPDPTVYANMLEERMRAKKSGDKAKANALKLVANTTYGGMLNRYNPLYDARNARAVCITGQLRLLELAEHLKEIPSLRIIQLNTDGIMVSFDSSEEKRYQDIYREWMSRTGYELEEDSIGEIIQKDVNNYIEIGLDGSHKIKGGVLVRGIAPAGAFNVNNNMPIVSEAIVTYFTKSIAVEDIIGACMDILKFQIVAKASSKYSAAYHMINGEKVKVQKCNRVYATTDPKYGALVKTHKETGTDELISNLPEHCLIDNNNELTIDKIDKKYYIDLAKRYIGEFLGVPPSLETQNTLPIEGDKPMPKAATTTTKPEKSAPAEKKKEPMTIIQKLAAIRIDWLNEAVKKSGINRHADFTYFELEDIVPTATRICQKYAALYVVNFENTYVTGTLYDLDSNQSFTFHVETVDIAEPAKYRMNEIQALGAKITYMRRYMYALMLDICDPDKIDSEETASVSPVELPKRHVNDSERKDIAEKLTSQDTEADALQKKALSDVMKKLLAADPSKEELIQTILVKTNNLASITKANCDALITSLRSMLDGGSPDEVE